MPGSPETQRNSHGLLSHGTKASAIVVLAVLALAVLQACAGSDGSASSGGAVVLAAPDEAEADLPKNDASPPGNLPDRPAGSFGYSRYVFEEVGDRIITTLVEGPLGEQVRVPMSYEALRDMLESGADAAELRMPPEDLATLVAQLNQVRASTEKYRDIDAARADGFVQTTDEVPNMGAHFLNVARSLDGEFDPSKPEILLYVHNDQGEWELVGTSFILPTEQVGPDHPDAFAGPLDNWHVHYSVCTGPNVASRSSTAEECRQQDGLWAPTLGWMIHAWVWEDNPLGVFNMWNPRIPPLVEAADVRLSRSTAVEEANARTLSIVNFSFESAEIGVGESLAWTNVDGVPHTVTAGSRGEASGDYDSGLIAPGQSFVLRFDQPGEFSFTCTLHPSMTGTVTVTE